MSGIRFHCKSLWAYDGTVNSHKCCFDKKIGKETKATETIERKEGNNEVCSDEQPLSYHGIAQFTLETENCNFSKSAKWKEWEMNNACSKALVASNTNSDNSVFRSPFQSYWLTSKIPPHDFPAQAPMSNVHWYYGDKFYYFIMYDQNNILCSGWDWGFLWSLNDDMRWPHVLAFETGKWRRDFFSHLGGKIPVEDACHYGIMSNLQS